MDSERTIPVLRERILEIRDSLVATEDTVCLDRARLVTDAHHRFAGAPPPIRQAKTFAHVLRHMTLDVTSNPIFAGNTSSRPRAWMLLPEYGFREAPQIVHENPSLKGILDDAIPQAMRDYWADRSFGGTSGIGHLAVDLDRVVHEGLRAQIARIDRCLWRGPREQQTMRQAMRITLQAVIDWAGRYAAASEAAAEQAEDAATRAVLLRVAHACRWVPANPARTLFEGLQAIILIHLALHLEGHGLSVSIGLPDRVLAPFIDAETDLERMTMDVAAFMLKIAANSVFGRGSKTQAITVGGRDAQGRDRSNALTRAFLEAADLIRVGDPHIFLRWHAGIDGALKRRALQMLADGASMPLLIHDGPTARGFIAAGVEEADAWDYCVIGCNELGIPGRSAESATATSGTVQYLALLNGVLLEHPDPQAIEDVDTLLALLEAHMRDRVLAMRARGQAHRQKVARDMPMPLTSTLMRGCIRRGQDFMVGMRYHLPNSYERGLTNAVNALTAIDAVVFRERDVTMAELIDALRRDFEGDEDLRVRLRAAPKWGNDDADVDRWAEVLLAMRERVLDEVDESTGSAPHLVCHVVRSLHYFDGWRIGASADGRRAWSPVADSVGAEIGTANAGPTGVLNSVLKLAPARYYRGGTNLNLTLPGAEWQRPEALETLVSMVETFFEQGGQELQVAIFDPETLREARDHPERYGDLLVRVAGFNARFVDLAPVEQDELIRRAESA